MLGKKFVIALAAMSIFNLSNVNFDLNFMSVSKVYAATNQELAEQKFDEGRNLYGDDYEGAIIKFTEAIKLDPNNEDYYYVRGRVYSELGEYEKAVDDLSKAIELDPNFDGAYYHRGMTYKKWGEYAKAVDDFNEALRRDPDSILNVDV